MLGAINGNPLNLSEISSAGDYPYVLAAFSVVQASATSASAGVTSVMSVADLDQAAHTLSAAAANAIVAASTLAQAAHVLSAAVAAAIGSDLIAANDSQGIGGTSTGAIAALLDAIGTGDTVESTAEAEAIKAALDFMQQSHALSATGTVLAGASLDVLLSGQSASGDGSMAIAAALDEIEGSDAMLAALKMLVRHSSGADLVKHGYANLITPHGGGSHVTVH